MATLRPECLHTWPIRQFAVIIALCETDYVLSHIFVLSKKLQGHSLDLDEAANESSLVIIILRNERNDPIVRDELFNRAKKRASGCQIKPRMPRRCTTQPHPNNVPAATPKPVVLTQPKSLAYTQRSLPKCQYECAHHTSYYASFHPNTHEVI